MEKLETDFYTQVHVTLKNGETVSTEVNMPVGSTATPLTDTQLWDKFDACVHGLLEHKTIAALKNMLNSLKDVKNTNTLMALF